VSIGWETPIGGILTDRGPGMEPESSSIQAPSGRRGLRRTHRGDQPEAPRHDEGSPTARIAELDGLRGVACIVILAHHLKPHLVPIGWAAVDLFFVLSGFLITSIILRHRREPRFLAVFYARRALRIWPIYYLAITVVALVGLVRSGTVDWTGLPYILTYTQNLPRLWGGPAPEFSGALSHTWSLAVEEQFYLLWPPLVLLVGARGLPVLAALAVGLAVASRELGLDWWLLAGRCDGFALGAILAGMPRLNGRAPESRRIHGLFLGLGALAVAWLLLVGATGGFRSHGPPHRPGLTVLAVEVLAASAVGLVVLHSGRPRVRLLRQRTLVRIGTISYGLYLYHYMILVSGDALARGLGLRGRPVWREALEVAVIVALAALSWKYVERPLLALKDHFRYERGGRFAETPHRDAPRSARLTAVAFEGDEA
jgi:peptidoglycan/LPS O-acetylase OafA/YrhL